MAVLRPKANMRQFTHGTTEGIGIFPVGDEPVHTQNYIGIGVFRQGGGGGTS